MPSFIRRAGSEILRVLMNTVDPTAETDRALSYGKLYNGIGGVFTRQDNSDIYMLVPPNKANIWDLPETPDVDDDEFLETTLNAAWSVTSGGFTVGGIDPYAAFAAGNSRYELTRRRSWLMVQPVANATQQRLTKVISLGTNAFVWMRGSFNCRLGTSPTGNDMGIAIHLSANPYDGNNIISLDMNETDTGTIQAEYREVEGGATTVVANTLDKFGAQADAQKIEAIGIQKIGTTYHGWAFGANGMGIHLGSTTWAPTPATLSLVFSNAVTTTPGNMIMGVDFVRVVDGSAVFLP